MTISAYTSIVNRVEQATDLAQLFVFHIAKGNDTDSIEKKLAILGDQGIYSRRILKDLARACDIVDHYVFHIAKGNDTEVKALEEKLAKLSEWKIKLNTRIGKELDKHRLKEACVFYLFHGFYDIAESIVDTIAAEQKVDKGPSKKVKQDDSVPLEQNAGVILLPEKQERKEELPEMNEEENGSPKRRHPDSKSE